MAIDLTDKRQVLREYLDTQNQDFDDLWGALVQVSSTEEELQKLAKEIKDTMNRVLRYIDQREDLNSLGELQSSGPRFDVLVAVRQEQLKRVRRLTRQIEDSWRDKEAGTTQADAGRR